MSALKIVYLVLAVANGYFMIANNDVICAAAFAICWIRLTDKE